MSEDTNREEQSTKKSGRKKSKRGEMSFLEHLEELRWHIIRSVLAISGFAVLAFINKRIIFDVILFSPKTPEFWTNRMFVKLSEYLGVESLKINQNELQLISYNMAGQFSTHIWTSIIAGFILASPFVIYEFWKFIKPALYEKEQKYASGAVFFTSVLFITGILFGYYLIVPLSIDFLGSYNVSPDVPNQIQINSYISSVTSIVIASGVVFLLPVFAYFLSKVGILTPAFMKHYRRHAYVLMFLLGAIITPPDVFSQVMVSLPLVFLYEVGIFISWRVVKKREKEMNEA